MLKRKKKKKKKKNPGKKYSNKDYYLDLFSNVHFHYFVNRLWNVSLSIQSNNIQDHMAVKNCQCWFYPPIKLYTRKKAKSIYCYNLWKKNIEFEFYLAKFKFFKSTEKLRNVYVVSETILFDTKALLILLMSAFLFLQKISIFGKNNTFTQSNIVRAVLEIFSSVFSLCKVKDCSYWK